MSRRRHRPPDPYPAPVDRLLTLGEEAARAREWPDYRELGLLPEHVPDLVRMALDPGLSRAPGDRPEPYAPIHAWRALGQLGAESAVEPLTRLLHEQEDSDWVSIELPRVFAMIGEAALPALARFLSNRANPYAARALAAECLQALAERVPSTRSAVLAALTEQLEAYGRNPRLFNAMLVASLLEIRATEAAPLLERAFAADAVVLSMAGDWEDVQVKLGLLPERLTPPRRYDMFEEMDYVSPRGQGGSARPRPRTESSARAKRKAARQARKRNRRR